MNIDRHLLQSLRSCLDMNQSTFRKYVNDVTKTKHGDIMFQDNNADILAVAHLDTVMHNPKYKVHKSDPANIQIANCPQLDDRLGAWVLLHLIPHMFPTLRYDILLTDSEEIGESTAQYFKTNKQYNWMFEFDRNGVDCVTYNYNSRDWQTQMSTIAPVGRGSFSDISYLEHLGCCGVNLGVGYYGQHSNECFANLAETVFMALSFGDWALDNQHVQYDHIAQPKSRYSGELFGEPAHKHYLPTLSQVCQICSADTDQDMICYGCQQNAIDSYHSNQSLYLQGWA